MYVLRFSMFCLAVFSSVFSYAQMHSVVDSTFGTNGVVRMNHELFEDPIAVAATPDGAIIGIANVAVTNQDWDILLFRLQDDGTTDFGFGQNGILRTDFDTFLITKARSMRLTDDGSIVVLAELENNSSKQKIGLGKFRPNGQVDSTFGQNGFWVQEFLFFDDYPNNMDIYPDGRIIATGYGLDSTGNDYPVLARWLPNGQLDSTFGGTGRFAFDFSSGIVPLNLQQHTQEALRTSNDPPLHLNGGFFRRVLPLENGSVLCAGAYSNGQVFEAVMVLLKPDGHPDSTFAAHGIRRFNPEPIHDQYFDDIVLLPDGKIVGMLNHRTLNEPLPTESYMVVYDPATDAEEYIDLPNSIPYEQAYSIVLDDDQILWLTGGAFLEENYNPNGLTDSAFVWSFKLVNNVWKPNADFGNNGYFSWHFQQDSVGKAGIKAVVPLAQHKIAVLGYVGTPTNPQNYLDLTVARLIPKKEVSTTAQPERVGEDLHIYPNPAQGENILVEFPKYQNGINQITVHNCFGQKLTEINTNGADRVVLNTGNWPNGLYKISTTAVQGKVLTGVFLKIN